jgi:hypothetical protein
VGRGFDGYDFINIFPLFNQFGQSFTDIIVCNNNRTAFSNRNALEHMVHQCTSEDKWFCSMFGIDVGAPPLPAKETRLEFIKRMPKIPKNDMLF